MSQTQPFPLATDFQQPLDGTEPAWAIRLITRVELVGASLVTLDKRMSALEHDFLQKWSTKQKLITIATGIGTGAATLLLSKVPALAPVLQQVAELLKGIG